MRIAFVHPYLFRFARGIERYVVSLSGALASTGARVDIFTWTWKNEVHWREFSRDVHISKMPYFRFFAPLFAVIFYFFQLVFRRYDMVVVLFGGYGESRALRLVRVVKHQPYCIVFQYPVEAAAHQYRQIARGGLARRAHVLIAVSEFAAASVRREFGRDCIVVPNGVDATLFHPSAATRTAVRAELGLEEDAPVLVTTAALEERKGVQWLIQALPLLLDEFPCLTYLVLGEGPYRHVLETHIERLSLGIHVRLLGNRDNIVDFLSAGDIGCLLSRGEAMPLSLIEFMAMQLPVVTSRKPPFEEFVRPGWGFLVDEQDAQSVAGAIGTLLRDKDLRGKMGKAAREEAITKYSWPAIAGRYLAILKTHELRGCVNPSV